MENNNSTGGVAAKEVKEPKPEFRPAFMHETVGMRDGRPARTDLGPPAVSGGFACCSSD